MASTTGTAGILGNTLDEALAFESIFAIAGMVDTLLYGMHLMLFSICMFRFIRNRHLKQQWFINISAVVMFLLSTVDIAITFRLISYSMPRLVDPKFLGMATQLVHAKTSIFVANNFVAELILLYRCCMVWGRSKYVLAGCSVLVLADTLWGLLGLGPALRLLTPTVNRFVPVYIWSILAINIVLTLVTVGRIFWISRLAKKLVVGQKQISVYHTVIAILVESSLLYSVYILVYILFPPSSPYKVVLIFMLLRVVAIMPTLLIVQLGMGVVIREMNKSGPFTTLQFEVGPNSVVLDTLGSSMFHENQHRGVVFPSNLHYEEAADSSQTLELTHVGKLKTAIFEDRRPRTVDYANHTTTQ